MDKDIIKISRIKLNEELSFKIDKNEKWLNHILADLEKDVDSAKTSNSRIIVDLLIKRKNNSSLKDYLIISGKIRGSYLTPCIRCLDITTQTIKSKIKVCFINDTYKNDPEFKNETDFYLDGETMDISFFKKSEVNIKEMVNEQIYLNLQRFPLHDENCKGLCETCGVNLNHENCEHDN